MKQAPLRWRWKFGIAAPLLLGIVVVASWFFTRGNDTPPGELIDARPAIAVLPFQDQGDDRSREYLADGLTQDLIHSLGRFSALTVMSWNAVATYKGVRVRPGEISRVLGVRYQVEGSVRYGADRVRVSAQLVDTRGRVLWSARYDEPLADLFQLQDRITREIAGALAIRVTQVEQQRVAAKPTSSFDAYDFLLRARPSLQRPTRTGIVEARTLLRQAIALDPDYAAAHSALGETFHIAISMGWAEIPDQYWERVVEHASEALRLDATDVRARILLGRKYIAYNQFDEAQTRDRSRHRHQSQRCRRARRSRQCAGVVGRDRCRHRITGTGAASRSRTQCLRPLRAEPRLLPQEALRRIRRASPSSTCAATRMRASAAWCWRRHWPRPDACRRRNEAADEVRRTDPTFDAASFGNKFRDASDLAHLREGLAKAGLYLPAGG